MGNFLVIAPANGFHREGAALFTEGVRAAERLRGQSPSGIIESTWAYAATFARANGTGTPIVRDGATGSWLLAVGTWFHAHGDATGAEAKLLARYLEIGATELARELEGFFVIVVGEGRTKELVVITDRIGSCHAFARRWPHGAALAGSSMLLAALGDASVDPVALQEVVRTGNVYEDRTLFREVRKLAPASVLAFADGAANSSERYWKFTDIEPESFDDERAVRQFSDSLTTAARRIGRAFERPVCDLTGGYDSRTVVAAFVAAHVSFSAVVAGPADHADVRVSRELAQLVNIPHLHFPPKTTTTWSELKAALPWTDGEYEIVDCARVIEIHRLLSERFDVSVNGSFGEVARAYWWELLFPHVGARKPLDAERVARLRYGVQSPAAKATTDRLLSMGETPFDLVVHFRDVIERVNAGVQDLPNTAQMDHAYLAMRMQRWQGRIASTLNQLWPVISPCAFSRVLEAMLAARAGFRMRSLMVRHTIQELSPKLAAHPLEHGYPALPFTWGTATRFAPVIGHYGGRAMAKVKSKLGMKRAKRARGAPATPPRVQLWAEEEVRETLRPESMRLARALRGDALAGFLRDSQAPEFAFDDEWSRLLTVEMALRRVEEARAR